MIGEEKVSAATSSGSNHKMTGLITKMWGMKTETVPVIVATMGFIEKGKDQNLKEDPVSH